MKRINKTEEVLKYLQKGWTLTSLQAVQLWRATRLGVIIHTLRQRGHTIQTRSRKGADGVRYAEYFLVKPTEGAQHG